MFNLFRSQQKTVKIALSTLLGLVGLSMVTYLIPGSGQDVTGAPSVDQTVLAKIGSENLTVQQVSKVVQNMTRQRQMPPELLSIYVPQIIQQMISERAMAYEATRLGMKISSNEAENAILDSFPADFAKEGKVDSATMAGILQSQGVTMADLKGDTSRQLLVSRLRQIVGDGIVVSPADVEKEYSHRNEKVKIQYALVTPEKYHTEGEANDGETLAYYNAHKTDFTSPEKRNLAIIVLDPVRIGATIPVSEADLRREYTAEQDKFRTPERVNVRHILVKADATNDAAMKAKAEQILKSLQTGTEFAKTAKEKSDDPGSGANGGELGWIVKGQTVPEFEKSAFSLPLNQLSSLVKTTYGYHILQVSQHEQAHLQAFEEVRPQLSAQLSMRAANNEMQRLSDKVIAELRKDPAHPEKAAAAAGTTVIKADNIQAGDPIPEIGSSKEFSDALAPLHKGDVTAGPVLLQGGGGKAAIGLVTEYQGVHPATFEEAKSDAHTRASQDKLQAVLATKLSDLLAKMHSLGDDLEKAAKSLNIEVKMSDPSNREAAIEGIGQANTIADAFTKPAGSIIGPITVAGGRIVAKVVEKIPADLAGLAAVSGTIRSDLKQQRVRDRIQVFEMGLKKRLEEEGKLKVHEDVVTRVVKNYTTKS